MVARKIRDIITINFEQFKMSRLQIGTFNSLYMLEEQFEGLCDFLPAVRREVAHISSRSKPDYNDMRMMGVRSDDVGYREVEVVNIVFDESQRPIDWKYKLSFLTVDREHRDNPGMRFGDTNYTREQARKL